MSAEASAQAPVGSEQEAGSAQWNISEERTNSFLGIVRLDCRRGRRRNATLIYRAARQKRLETARMGALVRRRHGS